MEHDNDAPLAWEELTQEERFEIRNAARARIFWRQLFGKLSWLKGAATIFLTLAAAWTLFSEAVAAWLTKP